MDTTGVLDSRALANENLRLKETGEEVEVVIEHVDRKDKEHKCAGITGHFRRKPRDGGVDKDKEEEDVVGNDESFWGEECALGNAVGGDAVKREDPEGRVEDYDKEEQGSDPDPESRQED